MVGTRNPQAGRLRGWGKKITCAPLPMYTVRSKRRLCQVVPISFWGLCQVLPFLGLCQVVPGCADFFWVCARSCRVLGGCARFCRFLGCVRLCQVVPICVGFVPGLAGSCGVVPGLAKFFGGCARFCRSFWVGSCRINEACSCRWIVKCRFDFWLVVHFALSGLNRIEFHFF